MADYTDLPERVRQKLETLMSEHLSRWYVAVPKPKMRGFWFRRKECNAAAPPIVKDLIELLLKELEEAEKPSTPGSMPPPSGAKGKPGPEAMPMPEPAEAEDAEEAEDTDVEGEPVDEESEEAEETYAAGVKGSSETKGFRKVAKSGTAVATAPPAISKMTTTPNRICACAKCVKKHGG